MSCPVSLSSPSVPLSSAAVPLSSPAVPVVGELFPLCKDALVDELTALMDTLGGVLWLPSQHQYTLTSDMTEATKGSSIGYLGSHRQNLPENYVKNSMMVGASAVDMPTGWSKSFVANEVTLAIVGTGTDEDGTYIELSMTGTAGGSIGYPSIIFNTVHTPTNPAQLWGGQFKVKGVSGTQRGVRAKYSRYTSGDVQTGSTNSSTAVVPDIGTATLITYSHVVAETDAAKIRFYMDIPVAAGSGTWDNVFRIYAPQLERGKPTAFTPTYGEAITRGTNFEPAWQDTTAAKPILGTDADGKSILTFDGSDDFFRTGIQTPEAGYIAGVWTHDGTASGRTLFASSRNQTTPIGVSVHLQYTHGLSVGRSNGTIETIALSSIPVPTNVKTIVDGYYSTTGSTSRVNGANEGVNVTSVNATSTNYLRIGAAFNGTAEERFYKGTMLAQVWIPGARPGATVEARIRYLLAQICEVTSVL